MVDDSLVTAEDMVGFPGAPFSPAVLKAASDTLRLEAGWHIAPERTETVTVDSVGGHILILPTLKLVSVSEVRDADGNVLSGWAMSERGMLSRRTEWPSGFGAVVLDIVHGYESCPASLLPVVASRAQRRVRSESIGGRSITFDADADAGTGASVVARFALPPRP